MKLNQIPPGTPFKIISSNNKSMIAGVIFFKIVSVHDNNVLNTSSWAVGCLDDNQEVEIIDLKQKKTAFIVTEANVDAGLMNVTTFYERDKAEKFFKDLVSEYIRDEDEDTDDDDEIDEKINNKILKVISQAIKNHWTWTGDDNQVRLMENEVE